MKMKLKMKLILAILATTVLVACSADKYEPSAIQVGVDKCDICNMQVGDDGFATQIITEEGKV